MSSVLNTNHRNAIVTATGSQFDGGTLDIYTGSAPGPGNTATGTLLASITVPTPAFGTASNGTVSKAGTWDSVASASGAPGYFRLISSDSSQVREGTAGTAATVMILSGLVDGEIIQGGTVTVTAYSITQPDGS
jgi:hypothetical protein